MLKRYTRASGHVAHEADINPRRGHNFDPRKEWELVRRSGRRNSTGSLVATAAAIGILLSLAMVFSVVVGAQG